MKTGREVNQIKRRVRKEERKKVIDEVLNIIDQMNKENEECNGYPIKTILRIEYHDLRERVMELKGGEPLQKTQQLKGKTE